MSDQLDNRESTQTTASDAQLAWPVVESVNVGYMTLKQAADFFGMSPATIRRWCKYQGLPHYHVPGSGGKRGKLLFRKGELDRWTRRFKNRLAAPAKSTRAS